MRNEGRDAEADERVGNLQAEGDQGGASQPPPGAQPVAGGHSFPAKPITPASASNPR
jgi:hypothetical protein